MSIMTFIGNQGNVLDEKPLHAHLVKLKRPILTYEDLERLRSAQSAVVQSQDAENRLPVTPLTATRWNRP